MSDELAGRYAGVAETAARYADHRDETATFPQEAFAALREAKLLGAYVPRAFGGLDWSMSQLAEACAWLAQSCGSTALIFAMHQIQVACLVRYMAADARENLMREIVDRQLLIASSTTEGSKGGDLARSECAIEEHAGGFRLRKAATVMSYGAEADMILATARRNPQAAPTDQLLVILPSICVTLTERGGWNSLGMRGTCSGSFDIEADAPSSCILPDSYQRIHSQTMEPAAHILWSAVWCGIAAAALDKARQFLRKRAHDGAGQVEIDRFADAVSNLIAARRLVFDAARTYDSAPTRSDVGLGTGIAWTSLKLQTSELATGVVLDALRLCGLAGYRTDGEFSITRQLRDILSASIMINNRRLRESVGKYALLQKIAGGPV